MKEYDHKEIEERWSKLWVERALYSPKEIKEDSKFSVVIPPPNVTGSLHMGHALNVTLQDIICRWQRMLGKDVVWVPGFDHAGIATQYVVEKQLSKSRHELGREEFLKKVWEWVPVSRNSIRRQLERIGVSVDWKRERFTLDEGFSRAVRHAFRRLYEEGLIYRSEYIVSWCPKDYTALSDLEVEHEEEQGKLYYIRYPLEDGSGYITVATTRPETMLGDTAVAVHPEDERYKHLIGKRVKLPLVDWEREALDGSKVGPYIPIIADQRVKPEFGTGAVKITPAHDPNDFEIGKDHNLPFVQVMDLNARLNENAGRFAGLDRYEARQRIVQELEALGLLEKVKDHAHAVGKCYRCKTTIEPMVSTQWFVRVSDPRIRDTAINMVKEGRIKFIPRSWEKVYLQWMENLRDWCISRQIWWGHRIPVWYCKDCGHVNVFTDEDFERPYDKIIFNLIADGKIGQEFTPEEVESILKSPSFVHPEITVLDFYKKFVFHKYHSMDMDASSIRLFISQDLNPMAILTQKKTQYRYNKDRKTYTFILRCKRCASENLEQETDVLDTWFSSALWPFGVFGWPEDTPELKELYPTDLLVTGFDIIFFWVARMVMMGSYFMKKEPFKDVYIHALVRDEKGQKMSKTKGNVIDPLDIVEKYGADSLRFTLAILTQQGRDVKLSEKRFEGYKRFANKIWNAARFILMNLDPDLMQSMTHLAPPRDEDLWIVTLLNETVQDVNRALEEYDFSRACQKLYSFIWDEFCDWYLEMTKLRLYAKVDENLPEEEKQIRQEQIKKERLTAQSTLLYVFEKTLRLLHPFMPYITEELWQQLPTAHKESISLTEYPKPNPQEFYPDEKMKIERLREIVTAIRSLRSDLKIEPSRKIKVYYKGEKELVERFKEHIKSLARLSDLVEVFTKPKATVAGFSKDFEFYIPVEEGIDVSSLIESYSRRLKEIESELERFGSKLSNENFLRKAPEEEVQKIKSIVQELELEKEKTQSVLEALREVEL
ncbi:valine--tRNA ligase [Thermocrinis minervae]|uniref:Valine--tRNA ligase n=1 Tax=Thermocrinis minervae TaxID=381751 RepID=A0A1M6QEK7_9AQUI|nr:valine--tRNA ligase [Thermocrinis minervae]SHK18540.1 valyl-tRNA synthetase [Thermocrinis minervae]